MKHKYQLSLLVFTFTFLTIAYIEPAWAQDELGIKGGILFSNIVVPENNSNVEIEKRDGVLVGLFYAKENLIGKLGLQTELLYQQKGAKYFIEKFESPEFETFEDYTLKLNAPESYYHDEEVLHYISVPVFVKFPASDIIEFYVGPEFGYLVSSNTNREETSELNHISTAGTAGAIINFCKHSSIDLRYSRDLSSFDKFSAPSLDMKNHGFSITLQQTIFNKQK
jgi:hypothetical protein